LASFITIILLWVIIISVFRFIIPIVSREFQYLSTIDVSAAMEHAGLLLHQIIDPIKSNNSDVYYFIETQFKDMISVMFNITKMRGFFSSMLGFVGGVFVAAFAITFMTFFFLKEPGIVFRGLILLFPNKYEDGLKNAALSIKKLLRRYIIGVLIQITMICILLSTGFMLIGLTFNHSVAIGAICGLLNIVPYIGPLIGYSLGLLTGCFIYLQTPLSMDFPIFLLLISMIYVIVNVLDSTIFQPFIFSNTVKAHPLEIFIVILIAGFSIGPAGMILAIPVYTILRVIGREFFSQFKIVQKITSRM
jgi:predicted PurR-regulated permease PerM